MKVIITVVMNMIIISMVIKKKKSIIWNKMKNKLKRLSKNLHTLIKRHRLYRQEIQTFHILF